MTPWCVYAVATLQIPEHLEAGNDAIAALARAAGCDERALHNVLGHLVSKGVFEEPAPGRFALNDAARALFTNPFLRLDGIGGRFAHAWEHAPGLRQDRPPGLRGALRAPVLGRPRRPPGARRGVRRADRPRRAPAAGRALRAHDGWEGIRTVVDVGGGTGAHAARAAARAARARGHARRSPRHGRARRRPVRDGRPELLRPAARRCRPLPAAQRAQRLARRGDRRDPGQRRGRDARAQPADRDRRRRRRRRPRRLEIEMVLLGGRTDSLADFEARAARWASRCSRPVRSPRETSSSNVRGGTMAYDERLAARIREVIQPRPDVVEKKMFGGVGWMLQRQHGRRRDEHRRAAGARCARGGRRGDRRAARARVRAPRLASR